MKAGEAFAIIKIAVVVAHGRPDSVVDLFSLDPRSSRLPPSAEVGGETRLIRQFEKDWYAFIEVGLLVP